MSQGKRQSGKPPYEPSLDEIRQGCLRLQKGWSKDVEQRRATGTKHIEPYTVPIIAFVRCCDGTIAMEEVG